MNQLKSLDLFELDRVLENIAKTYAAPAATVWFKVTDNRKPTKEEYNKKVVEFVKKFENLIKSCYPENGEHVDNLRDYISKNVKNLLSSINSGNNKEVERSYRYFVDYN
jgi:hypothetical protein